jgi:hypothetical protein
MKQILLIAFLVATALLNAGSALAENITSDLNEKCEPSNFLYKTQSKVMSGFFWRREKLWLEQNKKIHTAIIRPPIRTVDDINREVNELRQQYIQATGNIKKADELAKNNFKLFLSSRDFQIRSNQLSSRKLKIIEWCLSIVERNIQKTR